MHVPVLLNEVLEYLNPSKGHKYVDGTAGNGGHIFEILKTNPDAEVVGIDLDQTSLDNLAREVIQNGLSQKIHLVHNNYKNIDKVIEDTGFGKVDGILLDLGFSSEQLTAERGFSFQVDGFLDMRFDKSNELSAKEVVNDYPEKELSRIIKEYGEDRFAKQIARSIVTERKKHPIETTLQLANLVPHPDGRRRLFQALRIEVNHELDNLNEFLPKAVNLLNPGGRLVIISFHSLEDRIVKYFFKDSKEKILTKKIVRASEEEIKSNPRSRSAKLRALEKN